MSGPLRATVFSLVLLLASAALAQASPAADRDGAERDSRPGVRSASDQRLARREGATRDLATSYLELWSAPNNVTLATASSFYGPTVQFHGRLRSVGSILAEKRRFAERWPDRSYRPLPNTTQVSCEPTGERCTVWSSFEFAAAKPSEGRQSLGIGEHELVVSWLGERPVIASETSRVVIRGRGNMSAFLADGL